MIFTRPHYPSFASPFETLRERAQRRRREAVASRVPCTVQVTRDGKTVENHSFAAIPRLEDLLSRVGPQAFLVAVRFEEEPSTPGRLSFMLKQSQPD